MQFSFTVQLTANYSEQTVEIKQLGTNSCYVEGTALAKTEIRTLSCGDKPKVINFLENKFAHSIQFKIGSADKKKNISDFFQPKGKKRKSEAVDRDNAAKKVKSDLEEENSVACDDESESDDEDQKRIKEQLRLMKENFKKTEASAAAYAPHVSYLIP